LKIQKYITWNVILVTVHRSEEPALTNMDISTGHMVLVSVSIFHHEMKTYIGPVKHNFILLSFEVYTFSHMTI